MAVRRYDQDSNHERIYECVLVSPPLVIHAIELYWIVVVVAAAAAAADLQGVLWMVQYS